MIFGSKWAQNPCYNRIIHVLLFRPTFNRKNILECTLFAFLNNHRFVCLCGILCAVLLFLPQKLDISNTKPLYVCMESLCVCVVNKRRIRVCLLEIHWDRKIKSGIQNQAHFHLVSVCNVSVLCMNVNRRWKSWRLGFVVHCTTNKDLYRRFVLVHHITWCQREYVALLSIASILWVLYVFFSFSFTIFHGVCVSFLTLCNL